MLAAAGEEFRDDLEQTVLVGPGDIDGTDAKFAEATGTPEPDGLTPDCGT